MEAGFIGLGHMGHAMAANLLRAGHQVRVWNRQALNTSAPQAPRSTSAAAGHRS